MLLNTAVFDEFPQLQTKRLILRELKLSDAAEIYHMRSNNRINQFIARPSMTSQATAVQLVEKVKESYRSQTGIAWAGVLRNSEKIIGTCGFNSFDHPNLRAEIGGELSVEKWGKNLAIEAVNAIVDFGFGKMNLHSIEAKVSPENRGAVNLLQLLGFRKEAHYKDRIFFNGKFLDMAVYSLLK